MEFSRQEYWSGLPFPSPDLPNPGIKPRSPTLQVDSLSSEPPGKPKNTGVGGLSLLQQIFPTQELNQKSGRILIPGTEMEPGLFAEGSGAGGDRRVPAELGQESQASSCLRKGTPLASR